MATHFPRQAQPDPAITPRVVAAGTGATWWADGWRVLIGSPGTWTLIIVVYFAIQIILDNVPHIGSFASWLLTPVFAGGLMQGCAARGRGEQLRVSHLFDGFKANHFVSLLLVGVFNMVACLLAIIVCVVVVAADIGIGGLTDLTNFVYDPWRIFSTLGFSFLLVVLMVVLVTGVLAMANWFAPALIVLRDAQPLAAMKTSLRACMRNWVPFLVYGLIGLGLIIVIGGIFVVAMGVIGYEFIVAIYNGVFAWKSVGLGLVSLLAVCVALIAVATAVLYGSTWASYRDTLSPASADLEQPPAS